MQYLSTAPPVLRVMHRCYCPPWRKACSCCTDSNALHASQTSGSHQVQFLPELLTQHASLTLLLFVSILLHNRTDFVTLQERIHKLKGLNYYTAADGHWKWRNKKQYRKSQDFLTVRISQLEKQYTMPWWCQWSISWWPGYVYNTKQNTVSLKA